MAKRLNIMRNVLDVVSVHLFHSVLMLMFIPLGLFRHILDFQNLGKMEAYQTLFH